MTSFTLTLISVKESFHDIFKKTLNITPVNITSFTVYKSPAIFQPGMLYVFTKCDHISWLERHGGRVSHDSQL